MDKRVVFFALTIVLSLASCAGAQPLAVGGEFQINSYTPNSQSSPDVALRASGEFVVVWRSSYGYTAPPGNTLGNIRGRRFDAGGVAVGGEFQLSPGTTVTQYSPKVAIDAAGDFVLVWMSFNMVGIAGSFSFGQRYSSDGVEQGENFLISPFFGLEPAVAKQDSGDFVVVWEGYSAAEDVGRNIHGLRYRSDGSPLGNSFQVNSDDRVSTGMGFQTVAATPDGGFIPVWFAQSSQTGFRIQGKRYDAEGLSLGAEFQANVYTTGGIRRPDIAVSPEGDFAVVWPGPEPGDHQLGISRRDFNSSGIAVSDELRVNTYTTGFQSAPRVAFGPNGESVVVWVSGDQDGSESGAFGQLYSPDGIRSGVEFQVNSYTTGNQWSVAVAAGAGGDFVVVWSGDHQDNSGHGIFGQRYRFPLIFTDDFESGDLSGWSVVQP